MSDTGGGRMSATRVKQPTNVDLVNALVELAGDYAQQCRCLDPRCHHYRVLERTRHAVIERMVEGGA